MPRSPALLRNVRATSRLTGPNGDSWYLQEVLGAEHPGALITRRELVR